MFWLHFGYILATFWLHSGYILATFWLHFGYILATFWLHSGYILATFWLHLAIFWLHFGYILAIFWLHFGYIDNCWRSVPLPCGQYMAIFISFVFAFVFVFIFVCVFVFVLTVLWQNYCSMTWGCLGRGGDSLSLWHEEGGGVMFEDNYLNLFPFSPDSSSSHFRNTSGVLFKCEPAYTSNCETCSLTTF